MNSLQKEIVKINIHPFYYLLFLLIILLYPSTSFAQPNFNLIPSLTISETYDSNIYSTSPEVEDYVTRVGVNLIPSYNGPNLGLRGKYLLGLNIFARRPQANVLTQDGSIDIDLNRWFQKLFKSGEVTVTEDFTFTPDLKDYYFVEERGEIGPLSSYGVRTRRSDAFRNAFRNAFRINVTSPLTGRYNIYASYSNFLTEYENPEFRDNITNTVGSGIGYALSQSAVINGNIEVSNIRIDREDSNSYSLLLGVRHSISRSFTVEINAGGVIAESERGDKVSTIRGGASLIKRLRTRTFSAGYSRVLNTMSGISFRPVTADIFYGNIINIHSLNLTSNIGTNYAINRSIRGADVDTHSYNLSGGLNYTLRKWLRCSLTASHFNQESDRPSAVDLQRNIITLTFIGTWE